MKAAARRRLAEVVDPKKRFRAECDRRHIAGVIVHAISLRDAVSFARQDYSCSQN
jgi:hypothetical protein